MIVDRMSSQDLNKVAPVPEEEFQEPLQLTQSGLRQRPHDETRPMEQRVLPRIEEEPPRPPRVWFPLLETNSRALVIVLERGCATNGHPEEVYEGRFRGNYDEVQIRRITDTKSH
jgi:hypothetical protein